MDPRHWADLGGTVHLAKRLEGQLLVMLEQSEPVGGRVMHTALPFQLQGLARALCHCPSTGVVVCLMFPPGETLEETGGEAAATSNFPVALGALARTVDQGGIGCGFCCRASRARSFTGPCWRRRAWRAPACIRPWWGLGCRWWSSPPPTSRQTAAGHGSCCTGATSSPARAGGREALEVVNTLLGGRPRPVALRDAEWLFHLHSLEPLPDGERTSLERAR